MKQLLLLYLLVTIVTLRNHMTYAQLLRNSNGPVRSNGQAGTSISVISANPRNGTIVKQGDTVKLSCRTNIRWFFCVWKGPGDKKQCAIQERMPENVCTGDNRITLEGGANNCDIILRDVRAEDYGSWMCLVTDPVKFTSDKKSIALEVGAPAQMKFSKQYGPDRTLTITEGNTATITCEALNAHPAPQLNWEEPQDADVDVSAQPTITSNDITTNIRHKIKYKAQLKDDGGEIKCIGTQVSKDGRTVLYENSAVLKLKVDKLILPIDNALTQKIGIISGVLLAVIFLILLCVFVIFAVCKRRRKRSRPPSSTGTEDTSPEEPPIKPIWTTPIGVTNGPPLISRHPKRSHQHHLQAPQHHIMSNTVSQATVSTQSTGSNASWEDRSVGGEIEDQVSVQVQRGYQQISPPSLHETHFESDLDDIDLPSCRTVLHHPDPFVSTTNHRRAGQRPSYAGRPSSSMLEQNPNHSQNRPQSAMDSTYVNYTHSTRRMPTPNGPMTTSVKSVFDCELGCFVEDHDGEGVLGGHGGHGHGVHGTVPYSGHGHGHSSQNGHEISPVKSEADGACSHQHSSPTSQTSEPKDV